MPNDEGIRALAAEIFIRAMTNSCETNSINDAPGDLEHKSALDFYVDDHASMKSIAQKSILAAEAFEAAWAEDNETEPR